MLIPVMLNKEPPGKHLEYVRAGDLAGRSEKALLGLAFVRPSSQKGLQLLVLCPGFWRWGRRLTESYASYHAQHHTGNRNRSSHISSFNGTRPRSVLNLLLVKAQLAL